MHVVSIYNNKGGVGKSTLTVGIAEFLASNREKRRSIKPLILEQSPWHPSSRLSTRSIPSNTL